MRHSRIRVHVREQQRSGRVDVAIVQLYGRREHADLCGGARGRRLHLLYVFEYAL
jgi:hypothetical protein